MDALSTADRFVVLLRQKLAERAQAQAASGKRTARAERPAPRRPIGERAARAGADDRGLRRTIVEQLLTDQLGAELANEPRFQQVVERVTDIIAADAALGAMLGEVMAEVRAGGGGPSR
ncbi:MAG: hypothetical protein ABIQ81_07040 [Novosphingobium sp.]